MKYLRLFSNNTDYQSFISGGGGDFVLPNVSYVEGTNKVFYHPVLPPTYAGDIVYKSNGKLNTINYEEWNSSLGTPVGVVVVPSGFAPDGKARMLSLQWASSSSTSSTSASGMTWGVYGTDTTLTNHTMVPTTDNAGSTTTGSNSYGYLPSDKFTGPTSYVDSTAKYNGATVYNMIPSPYLGDKPNPAYYAKISGYNNALSDFDGKGNTDVLVALGADYVAANAARNYKAAGAEEIEWYLPAAGELGYMLPRFNKIQAALTKVNSPQLDSSNGYWSSSEYSSNCAYYVFTNNGNVHDYNKDYTFCVRPFALLT